jgi:hypothetical protein
MKMSVLLTIALLIVGVSAFLTLGKGVLYYPAAWAAVGAIFYVFNKLLGPAVPAPHKPSSLDAK